MHLLPGASLALIDLSDAPPLDDHQAYYVLTQSGGKRGPAVAIEIGTLQLKQLFPVTVAAHTILSVYRWEVHRANPAPEVGERPLAVLELPSE